jgi:hypothetical protein
MIKDFKILRRSEDIDGDIYICDKDIESLICGSGYHYKPEGVTIGVYEVRLTNGDIVRRKYIDIRLDKTQKSIIIISKKIDKNADAKKNKKWAKRNFKEIFYIANIFAKDAYDRGKEAAKYEIRTQLKQAIGI